jgi:hypothetical protein
MNRIAKLEDLADEDKPFTSARKVGWLMKRQRFKRGERKEKAKHWKVTREEVVRAARAHGVEPAERSQDPGTETGSDEHDPLAEDTPF